MSLIKQPVFIVGAPRSGTNFLNRIFFAHPDVCSLTAPDMSPKRRQFFERFSTYSPHITKALSAVFKTGEVAIEGGNVWRLRFLDSSDVIQADDSSAIREFIVRKVIQHHINCAGGKRFVVKSPSISFKLQYLARLFPDARFINIYRDGRAVVNSAHKAWEERWRRGQWWGARPVGWKEMLKQESLLQVCAMQWVETLKAVDAAKDALQESMIEVKYADLVSNFMPQVERLMTFVGLDISPDFEKRLEAFRPVDSNWKWKKGLTADEQQSLHNNNDFMATLKRHGFV